MDGNTIKKKIGSQTLTLKNKIDVKKILNVMYSLYISFPFNQLYISIITLFTLHKHWKRDQ